MNLSNSQIRVGFCPIQKFVLPQHIFTFILHCSVLILILESYLNFVFEFRSSGFRTIATFDFSELLLFPIFRLLKLNFGLTCVDQKVRLCQFSKISKMYNYVQNFNFVKIARAVTSKLSILFSMVCYEIKLK